AEADLRHAALAAYVGLDLKRVGDHLDALCQCRMLRLVEAHRATDLTRVADPFLELAQRVTQVLAPEWKHALHLHGWSVSGSWPVSYGIVMLVTPVLSHLGHSSTSAYPPLRHSWRRVAVYSGMTSGTLYRRALRTGEQADHRRRGHHLRWPCARLRACRSAGIGGAVGVSRRQGGARRVGGGRSRSGVPGGARSRDRGGGAHRHRCPTGARTRPAQGVAGAAAQGRSPTPGARVAALARGG